MSGLALFFHKSSYLFCSAAHPLLHLILILLNPVDASLYLYLSPHFSKQTPGLTSSGPSTVINLCYGLNFWPDLRNDLPHRAPQLGPAQAGQEAQCPDFYFPSSGPRYVGCQSMNKG